MGGMMKKLYTLLFITFNVTLLMGMEPADTISLQEANQIILDNLRQVVPINPAIRSKINKMLAELAQPNSTIAIENLPFIENEIINASFNNKPTVTPPVHSQAVSRAAQAAENRASQNPKPLARPHVAQPSLSQTDADHAAALALQQHLDNLTLQETNTAAQPTTTLSQPQQSRSLELSDEGQLIARTQSIIDLLNNRIDPTNSAQVSIMKTNCQSGATCGGHAIINAQAIQQLFNSNKVITAENIKANAQLYTGFIPGENLETSELYTFADQLGVQIFTLYINGNRQLAPMTTYRIPEFQTLLRDLHNPNKRICEHFVFNTGGHWVVASIVKERNQTPHIYYQDSANTQGRPLNPRSTDYLFVSGLLGMLNSR